MVEYIEKEAAQKIICGWCGVCKSPTVCDLMHCDDICPQFAQIPAADVRPVMRGKWEKRMKEKETLYYKSFTPIWSCSECGTEYDPSFCMAINFCPNCGAKMEG